LFNQQNDNESDFCESYKSQVLGTEEEEEGTSLFGTIIKLLTILLLLAIIVGVSLYGYHYFTNNQNLKNSILPPVSMQVSDEDTISDEDLVVNAQKAKQLSNMRAAGTDRKMKVAPALRMSLEEGLRYEIDRFVELCDTNDMREGVTAFLEKRQPKFTDS